MRCEGHGRSAGGTSLKAVIPFVLRDVREKKGVIMGYLPGRAGSSYVLFGERASPANLLISNHRTSLLIGFHSRVNS